MKTPPYPFLTLATVLCISALLTGEVYTKTAFGQSGETAGRIPFQGKAEFIPPDHPLVLRASASYEAVLGAKAKITGCPGVTIAMVLISMGIPAVIFGPGSIAQAHTEDEYVEVDQILKAARCYTVLMAGM